MKFTMLRGPFAICKLARDATIPPWASLGVFCSITRTPNELSVICDEANVPRDATAERAFHVIQLEGPFDFQAIGILQSVLAPLAQSGVPVFAVSTYDTDWILIPAKHWETALSVLLAAGHHLVP